MVTLNKCLPGDLKLLQNICTSIYPIYFGDHWEGPGLELYLEEQFSTERMTQDLEDPRIGYFFICLQHKPVGFLKVNYEAPFEGFDRGTTSELEKMYISPEHKGRGLGKIALESLVGILAQKGKKVLFLCVLDSNPDGFQFYQKMGFVFQRADELKYIHFKKELRGLKFMYKSI